MNLNQDPESRIPSKFLSNTFIERAIRYGIGCATPTVKNIRATPQNGDHFSSIIYKVKVNFTGEFVTNHLIVKIIPPNEFHRKILKDGRFFEKEINAYTSVFPLYKELFGNYQIGDTLSIPWPKYYYSVQDGIDDALVLEDLNERGFKTMNRLQGLEVEHLSSVLSTLGQFHGYSFAHKSKNLVGFQNLILDQYSETTYRSDNLIGRGSVQMMLGTAISAVKQWPGYLIIASKMEKIDFSYGIHAVNKIRQFIDKSFKKLTQHSKGKTLFDDVVELLKCKGTGAVLNHGDLWVNNILFKDSTDDKTKISGGPPEVKMIDYQMARYGSPALDLLFLLVTSVDTRTRMEHWDWLLEHRYLKSFHQTIHVLGCQTMNDEKCTYSLSWLEKEMKRNHLFAFSISVTTLQTVLAENMPNMETLEENNDLSNDPFAKLAEGSIYKERFRGLLDMFQETIFA